METVSFIACGLAAALGGGLTLVGFLAADLRRRLAAARGDLAARNGEIQETRTVLADLTHRLEETRVENQQKERLLDNQQEEMDWLHAELEKRPKITRKTYRILTVGVKWTGKTSLTLKWANPLIDLGAIQGTKIERYERTVSHVTVKDVITEHVFEIGDWGGEHIVEALHELIIDEIHGLLVVVDLGGKGATAVDAARIDEQIQAFQPQSLRFFFGPRTVASCKTVVLFINKSDLLSGSPAEIEAQAKELYAKLVSDLSQYKDRVDIRVLVGSASYGHSTHLLFSHFIEKILPKNAYDNQLLDRLKADLPGVHDPPVDGHPMGTTALTQVRTEPLHLDHAPLNAAGATRA